MYNITLVKEVKFIEYEGKKQEFFYKNNKAYKKHYKQFDVLHVLQFIDHKSLSFIYIQGCPHRVYYTQELYSQRFVENSWVYYVNS